VVEKVVETVWESAARGFETPVWIKIGLYWLPRVMMTMVSVMFALLVAVYCVWHDHLAIKAIDDFVIACVDFVLILLFCGGVGIVLLILGRGISTIDVGHNDIVEVRNLRNQKHRGQHHHQQQQQQQQSIYENVQKASKPPSGWQSSPLPYYPEPFRHSIASLLYNFEGVRAPSLDYRPQSPIQSQYRFEDDEEKKAPKKEEPLPRDRWNKYMPGYREEQAKKMYAEEKRREKEEWEKSKERLRIIFEGRWERGQRKFL
ncbi:MAG: hypothetical protein Q9190_008064, partial [Brigantiaea leucoxantha]